MPIQVYRYFTVPGGYALFKSVTPGIYTRIGDTIAAPDSNGLLRLVLRTPSDEIRKRVEPKEPR